MNSASAIRSGALGAGAHPLTVMLGVLSVALAQSLLFLVQPFVWRNWSAGEVLAAWLDQALNNLVVAGAIGLALLAVRLRRSPGPAAVVAAIVVGAVGGEILRRLIFGAEFAGPYTFVSVALRWTVIGGCLALIDVLWRREHRANQAAERARADLARRRRLAASTEFTALQSQIEPHFLFNTLATVQGLYRQRPVEGEALLSHLDRYLRAARAERLAAGSTLGEELDMVGAYLAVCQARMGSRLTVEMTVDPALRRQPFPALALGTLVENAVIHGLEPRRGGGLIRIVGEAAGDRLVVRVEDDGVGLSLGQGGNGIGLANTRARLRALYSDRAGLSLVSPEGGGVVARIELPLGAEQ